MEKKKKILFTRKKQDEFNRMKLIFISMAKNASIFSELLGARDADIVISIMLNTKSVAKLAILYDISESAVRLILNRSLKKSGLLVEKYALFYKKYQHLQKRNADLSSEIAELRFFIDQIQSGANGIDTPASRIQILDTVLHKKDFNSRVWEYFICEQNIITLGKLLDYKLAFIVKVRNVGWRSIFGLIDFVSSKGYSFVDQEDFLKKFRFRNKPSTS